MLMQEVAPAGCLWQRTGRFGPARLEDLRDRISRHSAGRRRAEPLAWNGNVQNEAHRGPRWLMAIL